MKCPYCNAEMEPGYIQSRDGLYWSENKRFIPALPPVKGNFIDLRAVINEGHREAYAIAHNCPGCRKIVIDYGNRGMKRHS